MGSLLESTKDLISTDAVRSIAAAAGESPEGVKKGIEAAAATMLASLAIKVGDTGLWNQIMSLVSAYGSQSLAAAARAGNAATAAAASEAGANFLNTLFGANKAAVESKIAQAAGLSSSAGGTILAAAAPLVLGTLTGKLESGTSGLATALTIELPSLRGVIPAGMPGVTPSQRAGAASAAAAAKGAEEKVGGEWLWPVLLLGALLIGALVWFFNRGTDVTKPAPPPAAAANTGAAVSGGSKTANAGWSKLGEMFNRKLPDGAEISIPEMGVENKLIGFIESSAPVDKTTWFDFDRLLFASGSATLDPASQDQLNKVAAILKAFPKVKIKIGAYTDNQGDAAANLKLSDERAKNVLAELAKLGVDPSRMEAQGYGDAHPLGDNKTEAGRQLNRRISMRVTEK